MARPLLQSMTSLWTVAARGCDGGCEQACVGFWHCPSNPKKHFGVYKSRLSCAQRPGVPGREQGDADALGHVLGSEQQAAIPAAAGTAPAPLPLQRRPGFQKHPNPLLMSAKLLHFARSVLQPHSSAPSSPSPLPFLNIFGKKLP